MEKYKIINNWDLARIYIERIVKNADRSYDILFNENYPPEVCYQMSLSYLVLAETTYLEFKNHQYKNELFGTDIEQFDKPYEEFVFELNKCIEEKEDNLTWISSRHDALKESGKYLVDTFTQRIRANQK